MEKELIRLNKYLSEIGYCSRRAGDKLIESGRVLINNEIARNKILPFSSIIMKIG